MSDAFPPPPETNPTPVPPASTTAASPPPPSVSEWDVDDLKAALNSARQTLIIALVALIVLFASVNVLLFHQVAFVRGQVVELSRSEQQMAGFLGNHHTNAPYFARFALEMNRFAGAHPDFAHVLANYPRFQIPEPPPGTDLPLLPGIDTPAQ